MTDHPPQPTPGQHVWVEAEAVLFGELIHLVPLMANGVRTLGRYRPNDVVWRPRPDETAAEPVVTVTRDQLANAIWDELLRQEGNDDDLSVAKYIAERVLSTLAVEPLAA